MRTWFCLCAALWLGLPLPVQAQGRNNSGWKELRRLRYSLSLKVPTQLNFRIVRDGQGRPQLVGRLLNDKNEAAPHQPLTLTFPDGKKKNLIADAQGQIRTHTIGWPRQGTFLMSFLGSKRFAPVSQRRKLDLRRVDLKMQGQFPPPLPTGTKSFYIDVELSYKGSPVKGLPVTLSMQSNTAGLTSPQKSDKTDKAGNPLMTLYSNEQGRVRFLWQGKALQGPAQLSMVLSFAGTTYFLPQQVRNVLVVTPELAERVTIPWEALLYVGIVGGLLLLLAWGWRRGWFERGEEAPPEILEAPIGPIDTGRIERVDALEGLDLPEDSYAVGGVVLVVGEARALRHASVVVKPADDEDAPGWSTVTNERGHFMLRCEHKGRVKVTFTHPHFQTKTTTLTLPQPGKPRLLRVYLASYRHLIYETFFEVTRRTSSKQAFDPKKQTAREWLSALKPEVAESLDPLAKAFEKAYYGSIIPTAEDYDVLCTMFQTRTKIQP